MTATTCVFYSAAASRALWGHATCVRCAERFFAIGESMLAGKPLRCACGRPASHIVDGHGLCVICHPSIAEVIRQVLERLPWARTMVDIAALPTLGEAS